MKYRSEGCRNAVLIGLRRLNDVVVVGASSMLGGYVLGEISLSRSTLTADIYFIYVFDNWRDCGNGATLYRFFEDIVKERSAYVGVKVAILIRILPIMYIVLHFGENLGLKGPKIQFG